MWDIVLRGASQLRTGQGGVILGFDIQALAAIASHLGYDMAAFFTLITYAERGMMAGLKQHGHSNHEKYSDPPLGY